MKKRLAMAALPLVFLLAGCGTAAVQTDASQTPSQAQAQAQQTQQTQPTRTPAQPKRWVTIKTFAGTQNTKTASFQVHDGDRILWSAKPTDAYGGMLDITSYTARDDLMQDLIANTTVNKDESGTYRVHSASGTKMVYLDINTFGASYTITVQRYQ